MVIHTGLLILLAVVYSQVTIFLRLIFIENEKLQRAKYLSDLNFEHLEGSFNDIQLCHTITIIVSVYYLVFNSIWN